MGKKLLEDSERVKKTTPFGKKRAAKVGPMRMESVHKRHRRGRGREEVGKPECAAFKKPVLSSLRITLQGWRTRQRRGGFEREKSQRSLMSERARL